MASLEFEYKYNLLIIICLCKNPLKYLQIEDGCKVQKSDRSTELKYNEVINVTHKI